VNAVSRKGCTEETVKDQKKKSLNKHRGDKKAGFMKIFLSQG